MSPKQAFDIVLEQLNEGEDRDLPFLGLTEDFMSRYFPMLETNLETPDGISKFTLTAPLIQQAEDALIENNNISQIQKMFDLETIDLLKREYKRSIDIGGE